MNFIMSLIFSMVLLVPKGALAGPSEGFNEWTGRPVGCKMPIDANLTVHATYMDNGIQMCAVEIESYSWWDLAGASHWKKDFWFPCSDAGQNTKKGSEVSGTINWTYYMTCHQCNPGNHHTCTANFELQ